MAYTHITPGWEIEMSAHYYSDKNADRVAELIQLPREELAAMEEASVAKEKPFSPNVLKSRPNGRNRRRRRRRSVRQESICGPCRWSTRPTSGKSINSAGTY